MREAICRFNVQRPASRLRSLLKSNLCPIFSVTIWLNLQMGNGLTTRFQECRRCSPLIAGKPQRRTLPGKAGLDECSCDDALASKGLSQPDNDRLAPIASYRQQMQTGRNGYWASGCVHDYVRYTWLVACTSRVLFLGLPGGWNDVSSMNATH